MVGMVMCGGIDVEERKDGRCLNEILTRRKGFRENPLSPRLKVIWTILIELSEFDGLELRYGGFPR